MKKLKYRYRVTGLAELSKKVSFVVQTPGGPKAQGETVSTCLYYFDELVFLPEQTQDDALVLEKVKTPYPGYLIANKAADLKVEYVGPFIPDDPKDTPDNPPIKD